MLLTKYSIKALRSRVQSALTRADELTGEICPAKNKMPVAADITATVDLMISDVVEMLSSAGYALQQVEPKLTDDPKTHTLTATDIALIARADQKILHSFDLLNSAQQMIEGYRSVWGQEIRRGALWEK
jgi:outer membrane protein assembly factor BamA